MTLKEYIIENLKIFEDVSINGIFDNIDAKFNDKEIEKIENLLLTKTNIKSIDKAYDMLEMCLTYVGAKDEQIKTIVENSFKDKKFERLVNLFNDDNKKESEPEVKSEPNKQNVEVTAKTNTTPNTTGKNKNPEEIAKTTDTTTSTSETPTTPDEKDEFKAVLFVSKLIYTYSNYLAIVNDNIEIINALLPKIGTNDISIELTKLMLIYIGEELKPIPKDISPEKEAEPDIAKEIISIFIYLMIQNDINDAKIDNKFLTDLFNIFTGKSSKK